MQSNKGKRKMEAYLLRVNTTRASTATYLKFLICAAAKHSS